MSFGQKWTKEDADRAIERMDRLDHVIKAKAQTPGINERVIETAKAIRAMKPKKPKKPLMNMLELAWHAELKRRGHQMILCQAITLRLPDGITYRPDFIVITATHSEPHVHVVAYETKAPHRFAEKGVMKLRLAATSYQWITFILVTRDKKTREWTEKEIGT